MPRLQMVHFATVQSTFEAKLLAARLGSEGIVWELSGNVDSMYPVGTMEILVDFAQLERARELMLIDEIEEVFEDSSPTQDERTSWWIYLAVAVAITFGFVRLFVAA